MKSPASMVKKITDNSTSESSNNKNSGKSNHDNDLLRENEIL